MMKKGKLRKRFLMLLCLCAVCILIAGGTVYAAGTPGQVKSLKAAAGEGKVKLTWKKVSNADGYLIYVVHKAASTKNVFKTVKGGSTTSATIKNLKNGKKYYFCVAAYSGSGEKGKVGKASGVVGVKPNLLKPEKVTANLLNVTDNSVTFDWEKSKNATVYEYTLRTASNKKIVYQGSLKKVKKVTLKKLKKGKKYTLTMRASRVVGSEKISSKETSVQFTAKKDYLRTSSLKSIVQYSEYTTSNTKLVYSKETAEAFANYGNDGKRFNSNTNYLIWTNIYTRRFFLFTRSSNSAPWKLKFSTPCIVGRPDCQTPRTTWKILDKRDPAEGGRYACYLELYTYAIHSLIIGQPDWSSLKDGYMASAGCIRIMYDYAQYVYQNCGVGTTVVTR